MRRYAYKWKGFRDFEYVIGMQIILDFNYTYINVSYCKTIIYLSSVLLILYLCIF